MATHVRQAATVKATTAWAMSAKRARGKRAMKAERQMGGRVLQVRTARAESALTTSVAQPRGQAAAQSDRTDRHVPRTPRAKAEIA